LRAARGYNALGGGTIMTPTDPNSPALDPPATTPPAAPSAPAVDLLTEPTFEEIIEEWNRYHEDVKAGRLNNVHVPPNHYFAYYGGRIVDSDPDFITLQHRAAAKIGVHWARLFIGYCGEPWVIAGARG
jgi:hypothetical protein